MPPVRAAPAVSDLRQRLHAFVVERYPFAVSAVAAAFDAVAPAALDSDVIGALRLPVAGELRTRLQEIQLPHARETPKRGSTARPGSTSWRRRRLPMRGG